MINTKNAHTILAACFFLEGDVYSLNGNMCVDWLSESRESGVRLSQFFSSYDFVLEC